MQPVSLPTELGDLRKIHRLPYPHVLVVEDEYMLADDLTRELERLGADVAGPVPTMAAALHLLTTIPQIDGAILDIDLRGEKCFLLANSLRERGVPFVFLTGYDASMVPRCYADVPYFEKPADLREVVRAVLS